MNELYKQDLTQKSIDYLFDAKAAYGITVNGLTKNRVTFETQLRKLSFLVNDYCYGRSFRRNENNLKIVGCIEVGDVNDMLHCHLTLSYKANMTRDFRTLSSFISKSWYEIIGADGGRKNNLVYIEKLDNLESLERWLGYSLKNLKQHNLDNLIYP